MSAEPPSPIFSPRDPRMAPSPAALLMPQLRFRLRNSRVLREVDCGHTLWVDEGLASHESQGAISIRPAHVGNVRKSTTSAGLLYTPRGIAIDEQNDVAPANKFID